MRGIRLILAFCALAVAGPALADPPFAPPAAGERIVYRGVTLIDGTGAAPQPGMAVVTNGERIEAVLPAASLTDRLTRNARVVDLTGRYLLPGLIDSHQHIATPPGRAGAEALMRRDLYGGITAMRIMADDLRSIAELDRAARAGEIEGPDLVFAALMAGPSFFEDPRTAAAARGFAPGTAPWMQAIDDATDLRLAVARARGTGASAIKLYADLPARLVRRIAVEAHRQGLLVWAHGAVFPAAPAEVIAAGPDTVSHTCYLAFQLSNPLPQSYRQRFPVNYAAFAHGDTPAMTRLFREMRRRGIVLDATLRVYAETDRASARPGARPYHCTLDLAARLTDQARREGVAIAAGTDGETARESGYPALFDELELLVRRAGMTPLEAIRAATETGARAMGRSAEMGTIALGRLANLVVLARDPTADIANMRSILFTVKRGRRFKRSDYRPITRAEIPDDD